MHYNGNSKPVEDNMSERTLTLRAELVEQFESLVKKDGRTPDDLFGTLLENYTPAPLEDEHPNQWALEILKTVEAGNIELLVDDPDASENGRVELDNYIYEKWKRTQTEELPNG
jgi:hypothetical protein